MRLKSLRALLVVSIATVTGGTGVARLPEVATASDACDWSGVAWIGDGKRQPSSDEGYYADDPAPQFRKTFTTERQIRSALLHIAGLGFYEAQLNGHPLSDNALAPLWTPYGDRVLYDTYDVTDRLSTRRQRARGDAGQWLVRSLAVADVGPIQCA